jgi:hypothetical protein
LIWFVQIVHYPLFSKVGSVEFPEHELLHQRMTTWVVGPMMLAELASAVLLLLFGNEIATWLAWVGMILINVIWLSTLVLQIHAHHSLQVDGFTTVAHTRLVHTNWIRTVAWSARGLVAIAMLSMGIA